jgi:hypothetical protein
MSLQDIFAPYDEHEEAANANNYVLREESKKGSRIDTLTGELILTKEGGVEDVINLHDLRQKLAHLKENAHVKIRSLSGRLKEDLESLTQYVAWIYNSESYPVLYAEIQNYFHETDKYQPGTIGAYCGGCLVKRKDGLYSRGCSVICAGSIPPPYGDPDWDFCQDLVIWAVYNGDGYEFITLNEIEGSEDDKAVVFIEQDSYDSFYGFSEAEKKTLEEHNLKQVRLVYYNPHGEPMYKEISHGFIAIDKVKTRGVTPPPAPTPTPVPANGNYGWAWWMVIIIALVLLALFFFLCRCSSNARS